MAEQKEIINLSKINVSHAKVMIAGDGDLCLNKMNDVVARTLTEQRRNKAKTLEKANMWEEVITAIHWRDGKPKDFRKRDFIRHWKKTLRVLQLLVLKSHLVMQL